MGSWFNGGFYKLCDVLTFFYNNFFTIYRITYFCLSVLYFLLISSKQLGISSNTVNWLNMGIVWSKGFVLLNQSAVQQTIIYMQQL